MKVVDRRYHRHAVLADGGVLAALTREIARWAPDLLAPERLVGALEALPVPVTEFVADTALVSLVNRAIVGVLRSSVRSRRGRISQADGVEVVNAFDAMNAAFSVRRAGTQLDLLAPSLIGAEGKRLLKGTGLLSDQLLLETISLALSTSGFLLPLATITLGGTWSASQVVEYRRLRTSPEPHDEWLWRRLDSRMVEMVEMWEMRVGVDQKRRMEVVQISERQMENRPRVWRV